MKYCLDHQRSPLFRRLEILSLLVLECVVFFLLVKDLDGWGHLFTAGYLGICVLTWADACVLFRKYSVDPAGITVRCPFGYTVKYKWSDFAQIAVCRVHMKRRSHEHRLAIRFTTCAESGVPHNAAYANEKWSSELYEVFHWKSVISVEYSEERYREIVGHCPSPILDYRDLKADYE